jgi:peroxiredoxin Q/BCP
MLDVGQPAPDFEADTSQKTKLRLSSLRGRPVVIYFYPAAFTLGCSIETNVFRDNLSQFRELGAEVMGISTDDVAKQCLFAESKTLTFPLLADSSGSISRSFGVLGPGGSRDKRVTFVLDEEGVVRARFHHEILVKKHITKALEFLRQRRLPSS